MFYKKNYYAHILLITLFGILPFTVIQAQHWVSANGAVTTNKLNEVQFVSEQTVYAVGDAGTILKSTDGGESWNDVSYETTIDLLSLYFFDEQNGFGGGSFLTGEGGSSEMLVYTDNGGDSWDMRSSFDFDDFNDMEFLDNQNGWAASADGAILYTTDGGSSWSSKHAGSENLFDFHIVNDTTFWVAGDYGALHKSTDSGQIWETAINLDTIAIGEDIYGYNSISPLYDVEFIDDLTGYVIGNEISGSVGFLLKTTDGGDNWKIVDFEPQHLFYDLEINDNGVFAIAAGSDDFEENRSNAVYISEDDGATWKVISDGSGPLFWNDLDTYNNNWIVVGESGATTTFSTADDTLHSNLITGYGIEEVLFYNNSTGAFVTSNRPNNKKIFITADGGETWTESLSLEGKYKIFNSISFADQNNIWTVGADPSPDGSYWMIYHSSDQGQGWTNVELDYPNSEQFHGIQKVQFISSEIGFIKIGKKFLKTTDGGNTWTELNKPPSFSFDDFRTFQFLDEQNGWLIGSNELAVTTDGGSNWSLIDEEQSSINNIRNIQFLTKNIGYAIVDRGASMILMKTEDGGTTWKELDSSSQSNLTDLHFISPDSGYVVGFNGIGTNFGYVYTTTDGGKNFNKNYIGHKVPSSIYMLDNGSNGWITGINGLLLSTTNGGGISTSINENQEMVLPQTLSLRQNYPNPFNPSTTINYHLPKAANVTVQVFNLMGQHVATLVNQKQQAGDHQVSFNATDLASGMYFYRINTGSFSQTKKMMLIK